MRTSLLTITLGAALITLASGCAPTDGDEDETDRANREAEKASEEAAADEGNVQKTSQALVQRSMVCLRMGGTIRCYTFCREGNRTWQC